MTQSPDKMAEELATPRTDVALKRVLSSGAEINWGDWKAKDVAITCRQLERELNEAQRKLEFLKSKGLTVGMMKTSDKPEPYLVYVCEPDSEFDDTIHVRKVIDAQLERDSLKQQLKAAEACVQAVRNAKPIIAHFENQLASSLSADTRSHDYDREVRSQLNAILQALAALDKLNNTK